MKHDIDSHPYKYCGSKAYIERNKHKAEQDNSSFNLWKINHIQDESRTGLLGQLIHTEKFIFIKFISKHKGQNCTSKFY